MRSPFPGMDPFLETGVLWEGFHATLIGEIDRTLAPLLPDRYVADIVTRSYDVLADEDGREPLPFAPDLQVTVPAEEVVPPAVNPEWMVIKTFASEPFREWFCEIRDPSDDELLVTSIEVLSPSNKRKGTEGWRQFLRKRQGLLSAKANLVEIDLLRGGSRLPMRSAWPDSPYTLLVCRGAEKRRCRIQRTHYRESLPVVSVPLMPTDADVPLDLQPLIDAVYAGSRYHRRIDYAETLDPPLPAADVQWLVDTLKAREAKP